MPSIITLGGGLSEGTAKQDDVLEGKTFSNDDDTNLTGTIKDRGAYQNPISDDKNSCGWYKDGGYFYVHIPEGYYHNNDNVDSGPEVRIPTELANKQGIYSQQDMDRYYEGAINENNNTVVKSSKSYNIGYSEGRNQGQIDVKNNPASYGLESGGSFNRGRSPQRSNGSSATDVGYDGTNGPWLYFPYGYYPEYSNGKAWIKLSNNQAQTLANSAGVGWNQGYSNGVNTGRSQVRVVKKIAAIRDPQRAGGYHDIVDNDTYIMRKNGIVYYTGYQAGGYRGAICRILKNGVVMDNRDYAIASNGYPYSRRGSLLTGLQSFVANAGDTITVQAWNYGDTGYSEIIFMVAFIIEIG